MQEYSSSAKERVLISIKRAPNSPSLGADDIQPHPAFEDPSEVASTRWAASREERR